MGAEAQQNTQDTSYLMTAGDSSHLSVAADRSRFLTMWGDLMPRKETPLLLKQAGLRTLSDRRTL